MATVHRVILIKLWGRDVRYSQKIIFSGTLMMILIIVFHDAVDLVMKLTVIFIIDFY